MPWIWFDVRPTRAKRTVELCNLVQPAPPAYFQTDQREFEEGSLYLDYHFVGVLDHNFGVPVRSEKNTNTSSWM